MIMKGKREFIRRRDGIDWPQGPALVIDDDVGEEEVIPCIWSHAVFGANPLLRLQGAHLALKGRDRLF
jgi:hypothetical protein